MKPQSPDDTDTRPLDQRALGLANTDPGVGVPPQSNEGEGSRTADRAYREHAEEFVAQGSVTDAATVAMHALEGPEAPDLAAAEREGKARAADTEPEMRAVGADPSAYTDEASPTWWTREHETGWSRVKHALERDWVQTKADLGLSGGVELGQSIGDTVKQATGVQAAPPVLEPQPLPWDDARKALRFGFGAASTFVDAGSRPEPSDAVRARLHAEWDRLHTGLPWSRVSAIVMRGYLLGRRDTGDSSY
jgi:hypothetical protein